MLLTPEQEMIRDAMRAFAQAELWPNAPLWDREHTFPVAAHKGLAELGAYGVFVPEDLGGAGMDYLSLALILEEIAAGDGGTSTAISVTNCPVNAILLRYASTEQQRQWLTPLARGEMLGAFCLTEPQAGSDASALATTARRVKDGWVLNGVKQFITSGQNGQVAIVIAVTDKAAGKKGMSAFVVPTNSPGYRVARLEDKAGQHSSDTVQISFEECRVSTDQLIGTEGDGYRIALSALEGGRIGIAAQSVGMARSALDVAIAYAKERQSFGKPIMHHQALAFRLADAATRLEAARQLVWYAASLRDAGLPCLKAAAMAKLFASKVAETICSTALQTLGGYGYVSDFPVERIWRDVRVCQIYEGTSDIQRLLICREL